MKIRRINLFAGPGSGKTSCASLLFSELKKAGKNVEIVSEYFKLWAVQKKKILSYDQLFSFAHHVQLESTLLEHGVELLVCDAPHLLQYSYCQRYNASYTSEVLKITKQFELVYPALNIFLDRTGVSYMSEGRYESETEAHRMDKLILSDLNDTKTKYEKIKTIDFATAIPSLISCL